MQTYMGLVRNPADATLIFEACRQGKLPRIQRRLSDRERNAIRSGSVFVWDEKEAGMRRWTDGKSWSASRVAGSFLTYREMEGKRAVGDAPQSHRAHAASGDDSDENHDGNDHGKYELTESYKYKIDGLIKQSFSITTSEDQKLHLISYYGRSHPNNVQLRPPTQDPVLMHIQIPRGLYPESTLEVSSSPGQTGSRNEDMRYPGSASNLPTAPNYVPPQIMPPYGPHSTNSAFSEPGWDPRQSTNARPREIRPAIYEPPRGQLLDRSNTTNHPYTAIQSNSVNHQQQVHNTRHGSSSHTSLFHPYAYSSQQSADKSHPHEFPPTQHQQFRSNPQTPHLYGLQPHPLPLPSTDRPRQGRHPEPPTYPQESTKRTTSIPRVPETARPNGANVSPIATKGAPFETTESAVGQVISIPDLRSTAMTETNDRPLARDIPTDRLGRWQEETRVLDVLRSAMKL